MSFISVLKRPCFFVLKFTYAKFFKRFSPVTAYRTKHEFQFTANVRSDFSTRHIHVAFRGASLSFPESNDCNGRKQLSDFPPWRLIFLPPLKSHAGLPVDFVRWFFFFSLHRRRGLPSLRSHRTRRRTCSARSYVFYVGARVYTVRRRRHSYGKFIRRTFPIFRAPAVAKTIAVQIHQVFPIPVSRRTKWFFAECPTRTVGVNKPSPKSYTLVTAIFVPPSVSVVGVGRDEADSADRYTSNSTGSYKIFIFRFVFRLSKTRSVRVKT